VQSAFATAYCSSHVSGITGNWFIFTRFFSRLNYLRSFTLVRRVVFVSVERLEANTPAQPILILARDACLITPPDRRNYLQ